MRNPFTPKLNRRPTWSVEPLEARLMLYNTYDGDPKWDFANGIVTYSYVNLFDGLFGRDPGIDRTKDLTAGQIRSAIEEAMNTWATYIPLSFVERPDAGPEPADDADGNMQKYDAEGWPIVRWYYHPFDGPSGTLAHARRPGDGGEEGDIHFDGSETWKLSPSASVTDLIETATHELGHAIGLDHEGVNTAIMNAAYAGVYTGPGTAFLRPDDIQGIQSLYGAGVGYVLNLQGELHVYGMPSDDEIYLNVLGGNITVNRKPRAGGSIHSVTRPVNDGLNPVNSIHLHGKAGDDLFKIEGNGGIPTVIYGDAGGDVVDVMFNGRNFEAVSGPINFISGPANDPGYDAAYLYDNFDSFNRTYTVEAGRISRPFFSFTHDAEDVTLNTGSSADTTNVWGVRNGGRLFLNTQNGSDTVNIGRGGRGLQDVKGLVSIQNPFNRTTLNINDTGNSVPRVGIIRGAPDDTAYTEVFGMNAGPIRWKNVDTAAVNFTTGSGNDGLVVDVSPVPMTLGSAGGVDNVTVGSVNRGLRDITALLTVGATGSMDFLVIRDPADTGPSTASVDLIGGGLYNEVSGLAPARIRYANADVVSFVLGAFVDNVTVNSRLPALSDLRITTGGDNDIVRLNGTPTTRVTVNGGTGHNSLSIDDRQLPLNLGGSELHPDRWNRNYREVDPNGNLFFVNHDVFYDDIQSLDVVLQDRPQNVVAVFGTSPDIPVATHQTTIVGAGEDDYLDLYPRDAAGNATFHSNLGFVGAGGPDLIQVFDSAAVPTTFDIVNRFGPSGANIEGLGTGRLGIHFDVERIKVFGGPAGDTFNVESFQSGNSLSLYGGGGDDTLKLTPTGRNLPVGITSISSLAFDGGTGGRDKVELFNQDNVDFWTYAYDLATASLMANRTSPGGYSLATALTDVEERFIHRGRRGSPGAAAAAVEGAAVAAAPPGDLVAMGLVMPGTVTTIDGGGGGFRDELWMGGFFFDLSSVLGAVRWIGDGLDKAVLLDGPDGSGDTVHITQSSVGAAPGDNLFGAGGSLQFVGLDALDLTLGAGADTVYVQPSPATAITINAGDSAGDSLTVQLAGSQTPTFTQTGPGAGTYSFPARQPIHFSGSESVQVVATAVVAGRYAFYNNSAADGRNPAANAGDDAAIAVDKTALVPGQAAVWGNTTNYGRGINGIMIDVAGLPAAATPAPRDFRLDVIAGVNWLSIPVVPIVTVRRGAGASGSDRVTLVLPDGAVSNTWLRVTILNTPETALAAPEVFYFGNLIGDTGDSAAGPFRVNAQDVAAVRRSLGTTAGLTSGVDFNRDGRVDVLDLAAVRRNVDRTLSAFTAAAAAMAAGGPSRRPPSAPARMTAAGLFSARRIDDADPRVASVLV